MDTTLFDIELTCGARLQLTALIRPDEHTSTYVRGELLRLVRERFGANSEPEIKTFDYQV